MSRDGRRSYCTLDHANKRKELADRTPYEFWLDHVKRGRGRDRDDQRPQTEGRSRAARKASTASLGSGDVRTGR